MYNIGWDANNLRFSDFEAASAGRKCVVVLVRRDDLDTALGRWRIVTTCRGPIEGAAFFFLEACRGAGVQGQGGQVSGPTFSIMIHPLEVQ